MIAVEKRGLLENKRGQITIFIIIAILIVALGILFYFLSSRTEIDSELDTKNPESFIQTCLEDDLEEVIEKISLQGGSMNPEHFVLHDGEKVEYLCYTEEFYSFCSIQQPLLYQHVKSEIEKEIADEIDFCFASLKTNYEEKGYETNLIGNGFEVELLPKKIVVNFDYVLTAKKGESETYNSFSIFFNNNVYELIGITNSILNWEAKYGDAETTAYMTYYRDLKVEKERKSDGSTLYILTDRNNGNKFQFASRSAVLPPGFGGEGVGL